MKIVLLLISALLTGGLYAQSAGKNEMDRYFRNPLKNTARDSIVKQLRALQNNSIFADSIYGEPQKYNMPMVPPNPNYKLNMPMVVPNPNIVFNMPVYPPKLTYEDYFGKNISPKEKAKNKNRWLLKKNTPKKQKTPLNN